MQVIFEITLYRAPFTICSISEKDLMLPDTQCYESIGVEPGKCYVQSIDENNSHYQCLLQYETSAHFLQPFVKCLSSYAYRTNVIQNLMFRCTPASYGTVIVKLNLVPPDHEIIDYAWNERMLRLLWTRLEIENAFSWLSTLGGAYSALGDYFSHCADEAGRISIRQFKLSKMLGDESLAARSRLYSALALSQKGRLHTSRNIVRTVNDYAIKTRDKRLNRMCQGVWAKLSYLRRLKNGQLHYSGDCKNI